QVVPGATEQRVRTHVHDDEQVAGGATALPRRALALEPDALALLDPRGDAHVDRPTAHRPPAAVAVRAGVVDHHAASAALPARLGEREATLVAGRLARAKADGALVRQRAVLAARAVAGRT